MTNGGRLFNILHAGLMTRVLEGVLAAMQVLDDTPTPLTLSCSQPEGCFGSVGQMGLLRRCARMLTQSRAHQTASRKAAAPQSCNTRPSFASSSHLYGRSTVRSFQPDLSSPRKRPATP